MTYIRPHPAPSHIRPEEIMAAVLSVCRTDISAVCGTNRHEETVAARTIFAVLCRELTTRSYPEIALHIGRRSWSGSINAVSRYRDNPGTYRSRLEHARALAIGYRDARDNISEVDTKARLFA